ncbi:MAG: alpha/beta hydrolase [Pseudomonadota bacterium]
MPPRLPLRSPRPQRPFAVLMLALCVGAAHATPMTLSNYLALDGPAPAATIAYGKAASQYAELFRPTGAGPFPVVLLVHGGCWTVEFGGIRQMRNVAGALVAQGIAVWNVEYRRADEDGGGYPGSYQDVGAALDKLLAEAPRLGLDPKRVVGVGHSAGGQLVQWLAGRARVARASPLYQSEGTSLSEVISLGGLADLRNEQALIRASCGRDTLALAGSPSAARPDVFADTNAAELVPNGSHSVLITGELDTISPPRAAHDYARRARAAGDAAEVVIVAGASHYDEIAADSPAWSALLQAIRAALHLTN